MNRRHHSGGGMVKGGNEVEEGTRGDGQLTSNQELHNIIQQFPQDELMYAFGYGSGVFSQQLSTTTTAAAAAAAANGGGGAAAAGGMLDLILVVKDARKFHRANINKHPHHYASWIKLGGGDGSTANWLQRNFMFPDAKVLFHVINDGDDPVLPPMKYGIVSWEDLCKDLLQWDFLYLAGRLHKPTLPIMTPVPDDFLHAQHVNLDAAVATALLLSSPKPSPSNSIAISISTTHDAVKTSNNDQQLLPWSTLYSHIASLSYTGDFRMTMGSVAEDPQKINKLVSAPGQIQRFHDLYRQQEQKQPKTNNMLESLERLGMLSVTATTGSGKGSGSKGGGGGIEWDSSNWLARQELCNKYLPTKFQQHDLIGKITKRQNINFDNDTMVSIQQENISKLLTSIVAPAARYQSFKGIFTLGLRKSIKYASAKLSKGLFRSKR